ncbi:MAG: non-heme iron oxygenase ferredoxin subunit [Chloroflexi bacterium]|nr:non-heme iron oxygenase ferredoxin subunit [Chloroflexota bacterium]
MAEFVKVARVADLPPGGKLLTTINGRSIALFNVDGTIYAIGDICTHDGGPLVEGELDGYEIECPRHGARFDIRTGQALRMPAFEPIETYEVRIEGDEILVAVE